MLRLACVTLLALACVAGCSKTSAPGGGGDDTFTAEKAKELIPDAAGIPSEVFQTLGSSESNVTPDKLAEPRGETLTWWVMCYSPGPDTPKNPKSFNFIGEQINPARLANAISGPKGKDGQFRKTATLIQPEYITDCTCEVKGDAATGVVSFKAEKAYEGKVEYTARKKDGKWRIEEFRLPDYKTTLALGAAGKWVKK